MPNPSQGPEFSKDREFGVILEDLRSRFRVFGEGLEDVQNKVSQIPEICDRLSCLEGDMAAVKAAFKTLATKKDLEESNKEFNKRLTAVESR